VLIISFPYLVFLILTVFFLVDVSFGNATFLEVFEIVDFLQIVFDFITSILAGDAFAEMAWCFNLFLMPPADFLAVTLTEVTGDPLAS